jgi:Fe-S-cluster containining protein
LFDDYSSFLADVQKHADEIQAMHPSHLSCKAGCSECCDKISVLKIEYDFLKDYISKNSIEIKTSKASQFCALLKEGLCRVYDRRPVICRTHGLPLLYLIEEPEQEKNTEYQLSFCDLNFQSLASDRLEDYFDGSNTLDMGQINFVLMKLNIEYCKKIGQPDSAGRRYDLEELVKPS